MVVVSILAFASREVAEENGCLQCQILGAKTAGPAHKEVAKRYAQGCSRQAVRKGERRRTGHMGWHSHAANPEVKDADLKQIIARALSLK